MRKGLDLTGIDLNLLPKFRALYRHRSVSEAGRELHLTQSALSNALAKMRALFADELFVRAGNGMEPTALAHAMAAPIDRALARLETEFSQIKGFQPELSARSFRIAMTQLAEVWLAPRILSFSRSAAPNIVVNTVMGGDRGFETALRGGNIDFVVGHLPELGAGFRDHEVGAHEFVCVARSGHPVLAGGAPTLRALMACRFVEIIEAGSMYGILSRAILRSAQIDALAYQTSNILALPHVIASTDLVAVMPAWYAARSAATLDLRLIRVHPGGDRGSIRMFWHENFERDPGHLWMRSLIARAAAEFDVEEVLDDVTIVSVRDEHDGA